jgi:hypothetical protein
MLGSRHDASKYIKWCSGGLLGLNLMIMGFMLVRKHSFIAWFVDDGLNNKHKFRTWLICSAITSVLYLSVFATF